MSYHDGSHTGAAIFVNKENLVFSMPLISLCALYAFFKYVPTQIGLSMVGAGIVLYKLTTSIKNRAIERKEEKIANLDESLLKELAADDLEREEKEAQKLLKNKSKAQNKARQRIKAQKKADNKKANGSATNDDEDDDLNVSSFAKSNGKPKRK